MPLTDLRRRAVRLALQTFRQLPVPLRRSIVRAGTPSFTVGAVAAIEHDGKLLFLGQPHRAGWSLPGGLLERREAPDVGVVREVMEETGLRITVGLPLTCLVNPIARRVDVIYLVPTQTLPEVVCGGEAETFRWIRPDEVESADDSTTEILAAIAETRQRPIEGSVAS